MAIPSHRPASLPLPSPFERRASVLLAVGLTLLLMTVWTMRDWGALRMMRLPDNDDMMRIAQIRDWLGGQRFNDLMQYRLGPPGGASMHWSRLADIVPAAIILMLTPLTGAHDAEIVAVIAWPAMLFLGYLLLAGAIARQLGGPRAMPVAVILAALAFPTISLFVPGRIDHHALQIVLILCVANGLVSRPSWRTGGTIGVAAAASLAIGLEAAPELIAAMAGMGWLWLTGGQDEDRRALGFAATLGGATGLMLVFMHPDAWPREWCDGFTPASTAATLALAAGWAGLAVGGRWMNGWHQRLLLAGVVGAVVAGSVLYTSPVCLAGPYDALHPFLKSAWMENVAEARGLFFEQNSPGITLAFAMLSCIGTLAAVVHAVRSGERRWVATAALLGISLVAAIAQVRVTYILAGLAAIPIACGIARRNGPGDMPLRLALWAVGAGVSWYAIGVSIDTVVAQPDARARRIYAECIQAGPFRRLGAQPPGLVAAPIGDGAYLIGLTPHRVLSAPYHRNNSGNLASYRLFLSPPDRAATMAVRMGVDYIAVCPADLHEPDVATLRHGSLIAALQAGHVPTWLEPILTGGTLRAFRVREQRLWQAGGSH